MKNYLQIIYMLHYLWDRKILNYMLKNLLQTVINKLLTVGQKYHGTPLEYSKDGFAQWEEVNIATGASFPNKEPRNFTVRNQSWSGSCVDQTIAKMLEVADWIKDQILTVYSATPGYQNRSNRPQPGRIGTEALDWPMTHGVWLEDDAPSQMMSDQQMDSAFVNPEKKFKNLKPNKKLLLPLDFYIVAEHIQKYGAVMLWFKAGMEEWQKDIPYGNSNSEAVRHSVTGVDTISYKRIEYIIIEDSWGKWNKTSDIPLKDGQRAITKEFFDKHNYFAGTYTEFLYEPETQPTFKYEFKTILEFGQRNDEIIKLQDALKFDGLFPTSIKSTGYYGDQTRRSVLDFQIKYNVAPKHELLTVNGRRVGSKTLSKLNELFNK